MCDIHHILQTEDTCFDCGQSKGDIEANGESYKPLVWGMGRDHEILAWIKRADDDAYAGTGSTGGMFP